jgi:cysteinyl-tRNA synthetase
MSVKYLGPFFDIHCGGEDHLSVHHTNEIAQTAACYHTNLANFWLHGAFLLLDDAKMSKSAGGFIRLQTLSDQGIDPLAYRFFCMSALYSAKLNFNLESLAGAARSLDRLRNQVFEWGQPGIVDAEMVSQFTAMINDNLNMPKALAVTWELVKSELPPAVKKATILQFDRVLGLRLAEWKPAEHTVPPEIEQLVQARQLARKEKRFNDADALRDKVLQAGYEIEDTPSGPRVKIRKDF